MPDTISPTAASMTRVGLAAEALVWWLGGDPRVQAAYLAWRVRHGLLPGVTVTEALLQSARLAKDQDIQHLDLMVRKELGLNYPWLAPVLLFDFAVTVFDKGSVKVVPEDVGLPAGRSPKADAEYIGRDVQWFYRHKIKRPSDSVRKLGREHLATQGGEYGGDGRAAVQAGINRISLWLDVLTLER